MPLPYVKKVAKKKGKSTAFAETKWAQAKQAASDQGHGDDYGYITAIFKKMMHESEQSQFPLLQLLNDESKKI